MAEFEILTTCRYYMELHLDGSQEPVDGYFMECQGYQRSQEVIELCEVTPQIWGQNGTARGRVVRTKMPGNPKNEKVVLRRGLNISMTMWTWFNAVEQGNWAKQLKDGDLTIYNQGAEEQVRFRFLGAWPTRYKVADVKAGGNEFAIEEVEISVDEFLRIK
ncbi:MAG TPA: phage tail protein [Cyanobacteria bacterium UBA8543]|nr:phage tail protein [Cyanobacteria bacterium UBA8543]